MWTQCFVGGSQIRHRPRNLVDITNTSAELSEFHKVAGRLVDIGGQDWWALLLDIGCSLSGGFGKSCKLFGRFVK
jgi:hypothetical protein